MSCFEKQSSLNLSNKWLLIPMKASCPAGNDRSPTVCLADTKLSVEYEAEHSMTIVLRCLSSHRCESDESWLNHYCAVESQVLWHQSWSAPWLITSISFHSTRSKNDINLRQRTPYACYSKPKSGAMCGKRSLPWTLGRINVTEAKVSSFKLHLYM